MPYMKHFISLTIALLFLICISCEKEDNSTESIAKPGTSTSRSAGLLSKRHEEAATQQSDGSPSTTSQPIVAAARNQIGKTTIYDPAYVGLDYPDGDVAIERGVCTDVVIRALRDAYGMDLQQLVHEDMSQHFSAYPNIWGLNRPDKNIDHRRVPNLRRYFERHDFEVNSAEQHQYKPGDIVTCVIGSRPHIMIISDQMADTGQLLVIHNIGRGAVEDDRLSDFTMTGHYRINEQNQTPR